MKNILVVGGGIAGLTVASVLSRHAQVDLVESAPHFGGLLGQAYSRDGLNFDYGSHYLQKTGDAELDDLLFSCLTPDNSQEIDLNGGSFYQRLNQQAPTLDLNDLGVHSPMYQVLAAHLAASQEASDQPVSSLADYLLPRFGQTVVDAVLAPVYAKLFGCDTTQLHPYAKELFGLTRVQFGGDLFVQGLKQLPYFDGFLAFNHRLRRDKLIYPHQGMGEFIRLLTEKMATYPQLSLLPATMLTNLAHQPAERQPYHVTLKNGESQSERRYDAVFWTVSPVIAAKALGVDTVASASSQAPDIHRKISLYHLAVNHAEVVGVHYFYVYDPSTPVLRVTVYPAVAGQPQKLTVEVFEDAFTGERDEAFVQAELTRYGILSARSEVLWTHKMQLRQGFPVLSVANAEKINIILDKIQRDYPAFYMLGRKPQQFFMRDVIMDAHGQAMAWVQGN